MSGTKKAQKITRDALQIFPDNPWLLNSYAIASYELHDFNAARQALVKANVTVQSVSSEQWSKAYPGNDPITARDGVATLKQSINENLTKTEAHFH